MTPFSETLAKIANGNKTTYTEALTRLVIQHLVWSRVYIFEGNKVEKQYELSDCVNLKIMDSPGHNFKAGTGMMSIHYTIIFSNAILEFNFQIIY